MFRLKDIFNHSGFRKYFANTSWLFAENVLRIIAGLFVGIYVVRYLGPERFGIYSYALAFVALFGTVSKLGLDSITVRELVNHPDERDVYLGTIFWLKVAGTLLALCLLGIAVQFTSDDSTTNLYIFIIASGLLFQSFEVIDFYFQSKVLSKYVSICKLTQLTLSSLLKLYFIFIKAELFWFVLITLIDQASLAVSLAFAYWQQRIGMFFNYFKFSLAKEMLKNTWPLILSGISIMIYMRIDQIMIKEMMGEAEVGLYSAAVKLSEAWYFVSVVITSSLFPAILNAKTQSKELYYARLQKLYALMGWMAIAVALPMTLLSGWIVNLLYGEQYNQAVSVLKIQIWAGIFTFLGVASSKWLIAENYTKISFFRTFIGMVVNVALNIILIPRYGINGAAFATLISYAVAVFSIVLIKHTREQAYMMIISTATLGMYKNKE